MEIYTFEFTLYVYEYERGLTFVIRPELLEHASKFYGVKFRNKVTFSFYLS